MIDKYYTPDISDLFVGYETEKIKLDFSSHTDLFLPEGATQEEYNKVWDDYYTSRVEFFTPIESEPHLLQLDDFRRFQASERIMNPIRGFIRTPYLTKEQIEGEGWKYTGRSVDIWFEKEGDFQIGNWTSYKVRMHYGEDQRLFIHAVDSGGEHYLFEGKCPSINEFRKICKLIGV